MVEETGDFSEDQSVLSEETYVKEIFMEKEPDISSKPKDHDTALEPEQDDHLDKRMDVSEDRLIDISEKLSHSLSNKNKTLDTLLTKVNKLEETRTKDKEEIFRNNEF